MAMVIKEDCINCGNCEPPCPNDAISAGPTVYAIDPDHCTECVGAFDQPQCVDACPIADCITIDPARTESREALQARYQRLHAN
jgi:ferredoxin